MTERLNVWWGSRLVGVIHRAGKVQMSFAYAPDWLLSPDTFALSLSLPLQNDPFSWEATRAFFDNLLPELDVRQRVGKRLQVSPRQAFALLERLGAECAGALSILPEAELPVPPQDQRYEKIDRKLLSLLIQEIPRRPLLAGEEGMRLSLAGAQPKLPVVKDGNSWLLPLNGAPSTHILKPPIADLPESVENEAFCMFLARAMELDVPDVELTDTRPRGYLVQRYDRKISPQGIVRLHQEDFCQALGLPPEVKYENDGGPALKDCFHVLTHCRETAKDQEKLLRLCVFNFLIDNTDAHAKNLSLLYDTPGAPRLAPFYDLICISVYPGMAWKLAMRIGGQYDPQFIMKRHWERLGTLVGWSALGTVDLVREMAERMLRLGSTPAEVFCKRYGESPVVRRISHNVRTRCRTTLERLSD
ncbi:MAG: type II toxin-antitoxin system HipA family toxin [Desulfovibrio sp.]